MLSGAWYAASFQRQKRMSSLKTLLNPPKTKTLTPEQAAARKAEHATLIARMKPRKETT